MHSTIEVLMGRRERGKVREERHTWNLGLFLGGPLANRTGFQGLQRWGWEREGNWEGAQGNYQFENLPVFQIFALPCYFSSSLPMLMKGCVCVGEVGKDKE